MGAILGLIKDVLCWLSNLGGWVAWGIGEAFEWIVLWSLGNLLKGLVQLLPQMGDPPAVDSGIIGMVRWFLPVGTWLATFSACATVFGLVQLVRGMLRLAKALD